MAYPTFPALPSGALLDSSKFGIKIVDNTVRKESEGGYVYTRPRSTRKNRRIFKCGYTDIVNTDKTTLENFYESVHGGSQIFQWVSPQNGVTYLVRFKGDLEFDYRGIGTYQKWNCSFELEQA